MIEFTTGNLLDSRAEALVNTVNTVGVMGKGIALMFKEAFPENYESYRRACAKGEVAVGTIFPFRVDRLDGPRWIINFPTKEHWRNPSKLEWVETGLVSLRDFIVEHDIGSVAVPPLGSGNGGLDWARVKPLIERTLAGIPARILVFEPTGAYQNVAKTKGVERLTPARALVSELIRRYSVLGIACSFLEVQKLAYFLGIAIADRGAGDPLGLAFASSRFGPYAPNLSHLLNALDGSYLHAQKRVADAGAFEPIWFDETRRELVRRYLERGEMDAYRSALDDVEALIDGFESPLGLELLATLHWLVASGGVRPSADAVKTALASWPGGEGAGARKLALFDERMIRIGLDRIAETSWLDLHHRNEDLREAAR